MGASKEFESSRVLMRDAVDLVEPVKNDKSLERVQKINNDAVAQRAPG